VFEVGDYVIKIGDKRVTNVIINDADLLYPICRKYIEELDLFIEVAYLGDIKEIPEEEVYKLYERKRQEGKIWIDPKKENIVRLRKDNGDYPFEVNPETIGFIGESKETRKRGDYVICDTDLLYKEDQASLGVNRRRM